MDLNFLRAFFKFKFIVILRIIEKAIQIEKKNCAVTWARVELKLEQISLCLAQAGDFMTIS